MRKLLGTTLSVGVIACGVWLIGTQQAQAACSPIANTPTYTGWAIQGSGGSSSGCGGRADVLLREDKTWYPDQTVAQTVIFGGGIETVRKPNPSNGQYYIESRLQSGGVARSSNQSVG